MDSHGLPIFQSSSRSAAVLSIVCVEYEIALLKTIMKNILCSTHVDIATSSEAAVTNWSQLTVQYIGFL